MHDFYKNLCKLVTEWSTTGTFPIMSSRGSNWDFNSKPTNKKPCLENSETDEPIKLPLFSCIT